jgi:nicotinate-nucleotide adenylyltransferase
MSDGVVLFGGSFNPIHIGHLIVARAVAEHLQAGRLVLIPSRNPPHKNDDKLADAADRLEMARLAVAGEPGFEVSDVEIKRSGPSYSYLTIQGFRESVGPDVPLYWVIGGDTLPDLYTWYHIGDLVDLCHVVTAVRPGYETPDLSQLEMVLSSRQVQKLRDMILPTPRIDISATNIRDRIAEGQPISYLVPESVRRYIEQKGLYRSG